MKGHAFFAKRTIPMVVFAAMLFGGCAVKDENVRMSSNSTPPLPRGGDSPEHLVERMIAASKNEDLVEMVACLSPETRTAMTIGMYFAATMMVAFSSIGLEMGESIEEGFSADDPEAFNENTERARAEIAELQGNYNALVGKYGLPELPLNGAVEPDLSEQEVEQLFSSIDQDAFLVDMMKFFESIPGERTASAQDSRYFGKLEGPLQNLKILGDTASGKVGDEDLRFLRVDGRWYVEAPESNH